MLRNFYETRKCESPVLSRIFLQEICAKEISRYSNFSLHTSVNTRNILLIQKKNLYVSFSISLIRARWTHNNSLNELRHESILRYEISINAKLTQYFSSVFSFAHFPIFFFFSFNRCTKIRSLLTYRTKWMDRIRTQSRVARRWSGKMPVFDHLPYRRAWRNLCPGRPAVRFYATRATWPRLYVWSASSSATRSTYSRQMGRKISILKFIPLCDSYVAILHSSKYKYV